MSFLKRLFGKKQDPERESTLPGKMTAAQVQEEKDSQADTRKRMEAEMVSDTARRSSTDEPGDSAQ